MPACRLLVAMRIGSVCQPYQRVTMLLLVLLLLLLQQHGAMQAGMPSMGVDGELSVSCSQHAQHLKYSTALTIHP